ncbi:MAG: hypothetical protein ACXADB_03050 [Candidatus Hermodarchaeia archaeon]|jgi:hypothetical protein
MRKIYRVADRIRKTLLKFALPSLPGDSQHREYLEGIAEGCMSCGEKDGHAPGCLAERSSREHDKLLEDLEQSQEEEIQEEGPQDVARLMPGVTLYHADHGIKDDQLKFIVDQLKKRGEDGFFIQEIKVPGEVPCGIYGPIMGDPPVGDDEVEMVARGDREWKDRMIDRPMRPVDFVQAIGTKDGEELTIYTIYGGPLAPQNPDDPDNQDPEAARKFWSEHALSSH